MCLEQMCVVVCVRRVTVSRSPNIACILLSEKETESGFDVRKEVPQSEVPPPALLVRHRRWAVTGTLQVLMALGLFSSSLHLRLWPAFILLNAEFPLRVLVL